MISDAIMQKLLLLPSFVVSLTIHEFAHARTALAFGDPTAKNLGRCTLNPKAHLDFWGTLCLIIAGFGWAKPVPVNPNNLNPPRFGDIMVSLAGPLSNLTLAVILCVAIRVLAKSGILMGMNPYVLYILWNTMLVNILLCIFNMIPLYPLDGHHIVRELLPSWQMRESFMQWQLRYGMFALMGLILLPRFVPQFNLLGWMYDWGQQLVITFLAS